MDITVIVKRSLMYGLITAAIAADYFPDDRARAKQTRLPKKRPGLETGH